MNFKQGEKIVCVKPGSADLGLEKDRMYTCLNAFVNALGENVVEVLETMPPQPYHGYQASRFRKAVPKDLNKFDKKEVICQTE